jgi:hypothetical protein
MTHYWPVLNHYKLFAIPFASGGLRHSVGAIRD